MTRMNYKFKLRFANSNDIDKLYELRLIEYKKAPELALLNDKFLLPNSVDKILIVETEQNEIISTMQGELVTEMDKIYAKAKTDGIKLDIVLPTFYLSLAATKSTLKNNGFNSIMRLAFIEQIQRQNNINSLTGIVFNHAPRLNLMKTLGYELQEIKPLNLTYWEPKEMTFWATLYKEKFSYAKEILESQFTDLLNETFIDIN